MRLEKLYDQGKMPRTRNLVERIAAGAQSEWEAMTAEAVPNWWGRQALSRGSGGGGGILTKTISGGKLVYYPNKGKYNYMEILDMGRSRYDMKPALLGSSRARKGENGNYLIIAFTRNKGGTKVSPQHNTINAVMKKVGSELKANAQGLKVRRNVYNYKKVAKVPDRKNGAYAVEQRTWYGRVQRSYMKFVCLNENSRGWIYPKIIKHSFTKKLNRTIKTAMKSKQLHDAVAQDMDLLVQYLIKKANKKK